MNEDATLLQHFSSDRSEEAFAALVRRHLNLVYSAALRSTGGDRQLAEDVSQQVFVLLARRAATLARHPALAGWLYTTTHYTAAKLVRSARRRQAREREAQAMQQLLSSSTPPADWDRLRPVLDDAMLELGGRDREAVLLRYFENHPFAEVGARLGLSENAARMRVERALDKLQSVLARRGITSTAGALTLLLADHAVVAAPAGLAAMVSGAALAGAGGTVALWTLMTAPKTLATITSIAALAVGVGVIQQQRSIGRLQREAAEIREQIQALPGLRTENQRLKQRQVPVGDLARLQRDHAELAAVRTEIASLEARWPKRPPVAARAIPATKPVYDLRELDAVPVIRRQVPPRYPLAMRFDGAPGKVVVHFVVGTDGNVADATAHDATDPTFADSAVAAVREWKFTPGQKDGQPVATRMAVPIVFAVNDNPPAKP